MHKVKKRFVQWGIFLSALFAPIVAQAWIITALVVTAIAGAIAYALWPEDGKFTKVMNAFQSIDGGCWFCKIFTTLFVAINNITAALVDVLTRDCLKLLGLGLGFYILFKVLKAVISFGEIDPKQFFTDLFMPVLKCLVAVAVLANLSNFYEQIVNPLAGLSIGFATEITSAGRSTGLSDITQITSSGGTTTVIDACSSSSGSSGSLKNAVFGEEVNDAIQCFLKTASLSLIQYMALGATFISDSFILGYMKFFPHWSMLLVGICLFVGTFGIFISFPFKLVDGMFRLMFVSALMPLWVVLWVLPATRDYSKKAFDMFLNVMVTFIVLSVILLMCLTILSAALGDLANNSDFWQLLMKGKTKDALNMIDWSTGTFFTMLAMTFLALSLVGKTESFVNNFVGGSAGGGMGSALEATAMAGVGLVGSKVAKPILKNGTASIVEGVKKTPYGIGFVAGRIKSGKPFRASDIPGSGLVKKTADAYREGYSEGFGKPGAGKPTTGGGSTPPPGGGGSGGGGSGGGATTASRGADDAAKAARDVEKAKTEAQRAADMARVASHTAKAAAGASSSASAADKASEETKKTTEEAKKLMEQLRSTTPASLDNLLKNPAALGALISTASGGTVPPALATAGVKVVSSVLNEQLDGGNTKESKTSKFTDTAGRLVQENVDSIVRDRAGSVLSTISRRELIDPETKRAAAIEVERDVDGKLSSFMKEVKDENGQLLERVKVDAKTGETTDLLKQK